MSDKGVVLYTDASCRPNPGHAGLGGHGYIFSMEEKKPSLLRAHTLTNKGYKLTLDKNDTSVFPVTPETFIEYVGSIKEESTNNKGEVYAVYKLLTYIESSIEFPDIKTVHILTDSEYAKKGIMEWLSVWVKSNWMRMDGQLVINHDTWKLLNDVLERFKDKGKLVTAEWVNGHSDIPGNVEAHNLSVIGMNYATRNNHADDYETFPAKQYLKYNVEKHPLVSCKRIYFNSQINNEIHGQYYQAEPGGPDTFFGKRLPETGFSVVRLNTPIQVIEDVKSMYLTPSDGREFPNAIIMVKLDRLFQKEVYRYLEKHRSFSILYDTKNLNLNFADSKPIAVEMNPTGLSLRTVDVFNSLEELLNNFIALKNNMVTNMSYSLKVFDITNEFYDDVTKGNKISKVLKSEIGVGYANHVSVASLDLTGEFKEYKIPLILGLDLLPRNNLKKLETLKPKISLLTWWHNAKSFSYATIVECEEGIGIWSNYFSCQLFSS